MSRASRHTLCGRGPARLVGTTLLLVGLARPASLDAQLSDPCGAACGAALLATGVVTATGAVAAFGRLEGGLSTTSQGMWTWGTGFALVVGGGVALSGDGERQQRAVYAAGIGSGVGAWLGLTLAVFTHTDEAPRALSSMLIGAAAGALVGGVYGALADGEGDAILPTLLSITVPF